MSNLLEKASIVTTPTSYDNGKILSVKPEEVLSEELVTNGDFSNGSTGWTLGTGWTIEANQLVRAVAVSGSYAQTSYDLGVIGRLYKISINVTEVLSGTLYVYGGLGGTPALTITSAGVYTINHIWASDQPLGVFCSNSFVGKVTNVSVKEAIDGDFDFTRNSSATRVNSQGLIEDVQILSGNLVSNGDFSQEGSELITNGDFATDSDWTKDAGWTISNGTASCNGSGVNSLQQSGITTVGKIYKLTFDVLDSNNFNFLVISANFGDTYVDADLNNAVVLGKNTFYIKPTNGTGIRFRVSNGTTLSIDNVSVKEVGQDWILGTDWGIGNNKAIRTGTASSGLTQSGTFSLGKKFKLNFTITDWTTGNLKGYFYGGGGSDAFFDISNIGNGTFTFETTTTTNRTNIAFYAFGGFEGSITNISVIEITDDTNLPRINYEGFSYQDSLGSELVTNGDFSDGLNGWSAHVGSTLELENGMAKVTTVGSQGFIKRTDLSIETGKTYFCKAYITNGLSPQWYINSVNNPINLSLISENTYGGYVTTTGNNSYFYIKGNGTSGEVSYIDNVSVKEVLGQEVVPDSGCGSWLFEPQSTNLITQSELFSDSYWTKSGSSVVSGFISPDGTSNAFKLVENTATTTHQVFRAFSYLNAKYSLSVFLKADERNWIKMNLYDGTSSVYTYFDLTNGVVGQELGASGKIENYGNGWYKCSMSTTSVVSLGSGNISFRLAEFDGGTGYIGDGTSGIYIFGAQLEQQSYATSYIPTNGSTVTRLQDAAFGAGSSDLINSTEGVLYFEGERLSLPGSKRTICISDGSLNNYLYIQLQGVSNTIRILYKTIETGLVLLLNHNLSNELEFRKYAFRWSNNNFSLWINGIKEIEQLNGNTATSSILNQINFSLGNGADKFFGKTKCLAVFKEALTDEELECLTTI